MFLYDSNVLPNRTESNLGNLKLSILLPNFVLSASQNDTKECIQVVKNVNLKSRQMVLACLMR